MLQYVSAPFCVIAVGCSKLQYCAVCCIFLSLRCVDFNMSHNTRHLAVCGCSIFCVQHVAVHCNSLDDCSSSIAVCRCQHVSHCVHEAYHSVYLQYLVYVQYVAVRIIAFVLLQCVAYCCSMSMSACFAYVFWHTVMYVFQQST